MIFPAMFKMFTLLCMLMTQVLTENFQTCQQLKEELLPAFAEVCKWLKINKLGLNTVKTEFMLIGTSHRLNQLDQNPESTP